MFSDFSRAEKMCIVLAVSRAVNNMAVYYEDVLSVPKLMGWMKEDIGENLEITGELIAFITAMATSLFFLHAVTRSAYKLIHHRFVPVHAHDAEDRVVTRNRLLTFSQYFTVLIKGIGGFSGLVSFLIDYIPRSYSASIAGLFALVNMVYEFSVVTFNPNAEPSRFRIGVKAAILVSLIRAINNAAVYYDNLFMIPKVHWYGRKQISGHNLAEDVDELSLVERYIFIGLCVTMLPYISALARSSFRIIRNRFPGRELNFQRLHENGVSMVMEQLGESQTHHSARMRCFHTLMQGFHTASEYMTVLVKVFGSFIALYILFSRFVNFEGALTLAASFFLANGVYEASVLTFNSEGRIETLEEGAEMRALTSNSSLYTDDGVQSLSASPSGDEMSTLTSASSVYIDNGEVQSLSASDSGSDDFDSSDLAASI